MNRVNENFSPKVQYSQIIEESNLTKNQHSVILDALPGIRVTEYPIALSQVWKESRVVQSSKISQQRILIALNNDKLVNRLAETEINIRINCHVIPVLPFTENDNTLILRNDSPWIPGRIREDRLKELEITSKCSFTPIRAGKTSSTI